MEQIQPKWETISELVTNLLENYDYVVGRCVRSGFQMFQNSWVRCVVNLGNTLHWGGVPNLATNNTNLLLGSESFTRWHVGPQGAELGLQSNFYHSHCLYSTTQTALTNRQNIICRSPLAHLSGYEECAPLYRSIFFHFHAVFGKNIAK